MNYSPTNSGWVSCPREYIGDLHSGKITVDEFLLLQYLRLRANAYAWVEVSVEEVQSALFSGSRKKQHNTVYKVFRSLKQKRFIYYKDRNGRRGPFRIYIDKMFMMSGSISSISKYFDDEVGRANDVGKYRNISEVKEEVSKINQSLDIKSSVDSIALNKKAFTNSIRGSHKEKDKEKENTIDNGEFSKSLETNKRITVQIEDIVNSFTSITRAYLTKVYKDVGIRPILCAKSIFDSKDMANIRNRDAFFMSLLKTEIEKVERGPESKVL